MDQAGQGRRTGTRVWRALAAGAALAFCLCVPSACMTPDRAVRDASAEGLRLATACWQEQTGRTNVFDLSRPADALTVRIALLAAARGEQAVLFPRVPTADRLAFSNGTLTVALTDALALGARNDRRYQRLKEDIFFRALDLDYQQYLFETSFSGLLLATLTGDPGAQRAAGQAAAGAARTLPNGADVAGRLALDVVSLLRDDWRSAALAGDLTVTVPLLRGAGREIVLEPLTQAERNLVYAIRSFEGYRQAYAVSVASGYYRVLEQAQKLHNARENERRLADNSRRAEMMFAAGRMQRIQVDQARTDLLKAGESVIASAKSYESALDAFKLTLGLPPESRIEPDARDLAELEAHLAGLAAQTADARAQFPEEQESFRVALAHRHDLFVTRAQLEDTARGVTVAADALKADVALNGGFNLQRRHATGEGGFEGQETWLAGVKAGLPWDRRKERNAFMKQLVALEQAKRNVEQLEDEIKLAVRNGLRSLVASRASYENQSAAMAVALLRVESNNLYLQSGRSSMRDVLEAESALLSARNALCSAMIQWRLDDLLLRRDMGVLSISEAGAWQRPDREDHG